jgi:hypothetical protein
MMPLYFDIIAATRLRFIDLKNHRYLWLMPCTYDRGVLHWLLHLRSDQEAHKLYRDCRSQRQRSIRSY